MNKNILPTNNPEWGFYGTIKDRDLDVEDEWNKAFEYILNKKFKVNGRPLTPIQVRDFLDAKSGRHIADQVINGLTIDQIDKKWPLDKSFWMRKELSEARTYEVTISTDGDNTQADIQQAFTTEVSRQATAAQQEYLAALVGGAVDEGYKNVREGDCDCDDPDDCECGEDDDDEDLDEATFKKMDAKQFTDLAVFKSFAASYQKDVDGIEVKRQQLAGVWKWFVYKDTDVIGTFDEGTGRGYIMAMVEGK